MMVIATKLGVFCSSGNGALLPQGGPLPDYMLDHATQPSQVVPARAFSRTWEQEGPPGMGGPSYPVPKLTSS
jgi:hypothetical protein